MTLTITRSDMFKLKINRFYLLLSGILMFPLFLTACSEDDEPVRSYNDILGVWTDGNDRYMVLDTENRAFNLFVFEEDGETWGDWEQHGYFYEPGYNFVVYLDNTLQPEVYKVITLTETELVWCWVDSLTSSEYEGKTYSEIIGEVIKKAQEGYDVDPALYQYFTYVPEDEFYEMLDHLDIMVPW